MKTLNLKSIKISILLGAAVFALSILAVPSGSVLAAPAVDLKINNSDGPINVSYNNYATLTWTATDVSYCYATGDWSGSKGLSGTETVSGITSSKTFILNCVGIGGTAADNVTVNVSGQSTYPTIDIKANNSNGPITVGYNSTATLSWNSSNASYCYASGDWYGSKATSGSETTYNITASRTYTITCTNSYGSVADSVTLLVGSQTIPSVNLRINGADSTISVPYNSSAVLNWTSSNADYCQAYGSWTGMKAISGSENTGLISGFQTYTIICSNSYGTASDSVSANVGSSNSNYNYNCQNSYCGSSCYNGYSTGQSCANNYQYSPSYYTSPYYYTPTRTYSYNYNSGYNYNQASYASTSYSNLTIKKQGRNLSNGTSAYSDVIVANPGETVVFQITVTNSGYYQVQSVVVKDVLPSRVSFAGGLTVDNNPIVGGDGGLFSTGLNIGDLAAGQSKVISFQVKVADVSQLPYGQTKLVDTATATASNGSSASASAAICVTRRQVSSSSYGNIASYVSTGITDNPFIDFIVIPLALALFIVFVFKSNILKINKWINKKMEGDNHLQTQELLTAKIDEIKKVEFKTE